MSTEWTIDGEEVLLQMPASYSERPGTMFCTDRRVAWYQSTARAPQLSLPLVFLAAPPRRNKSAESHLLAFKTKEPVKGRDEYHFQFRSAKERDGFLEVTKKLLVALAAPKVVASATETQPVSEPPADAAAAAPSDPQHRFESKAARTVRELTAETRRRAAALAGSADLRQLYEELVIKSAILDEDSFWALRASELDRQVVQSRETGLPSAMLGLQPVAERDSEVHYRLTAAMIRQIFSEQPAVRRAYDDNVPHKMTEQEFWKNFLQWKQQQVAVDMFRQAEEQQQREESAAAAASAAASSSKQLPASLDLRAVEGEEDDGGSVDADEEAPLTDHSAAARQIAKQFNEHGMRVLERAVEPVISDPGLLDDLNAEDESAKKQGHKLVLKWYENAVVNPPLDDASSFPPSLSAAQIDSFLSFLHLQQQQQQQGSDAAMNASNWRYRGNDVESCCRESYEHSGRDQKPMLALDEDGRRAWARIVELLRHFWSAVPPRDARSALKLRRVREALAAAQGLDREPLASSLGPAVERALAYSVI